MALHLQIPVEDKEQATLRASLITTLHNLGAYDSQSLVGGWLFHEPGVTPVIERPTTDFPTALKETSLESVEEDEPDELCDEDEQQQETSSSSGSSNESDAVSRPITPHSPTPYSVPTRSLPSKPISQPPARRPLPMPSANPPIIAPSVTVSAPSLPAIPTKPATHESPHGPEAAKPEESPVPSAIRPLPRLPAARPLSTASASSTSTSATTSTTASSASNTPEDSKKHVPAKRRDLRRRKPKRKPTPLPLDAPQPDPAINMKPLATRSRRVLLLPTSAEGEEEYISDPASPCEQPGNPLLKVTPASPPKPPPGHLPQARGRATPFPVKSRGIGKIPIATSMNTEELMRRRYQRT